MDELTFEKNLISYISKGIVCNNKIFDSATEEKLNTEKQSKLKQELYDSGKICDKLEPYDIQQRYGFKSNLWTYMPTIKTTEDLWMNFKSILESHNYGPLEGKKLSDNEFNQVKSIISAIRTPYEAGQFLYGYNGVSQVNVDLDSGKHAILTVFDQRQVGAGETVYQVVNQIQRPAKRPGMKKRIFDTTLLINGLPIIQIEEKKDGRDVNEALNQMHQYIDEGQYTDIFSTLQILVGMTPNNTKYMANTTSDKFNKDFAFNWQRKEDNNPVRGWQEFADSMLTIPMAHQMATNYMILDGTKNKESLKVMRSYQVYATQNAINAIKHADFNFGTNKLGYIWHTTGSGKTITSFKTAWLANRLSNIDKVVFVVDRIALTKQTLDSYMAYDPDYSTTDNSKSSAVMDTENTGELSRKLKSKEGGIIVTSVQKLHKLVQRSGFKSPDRNILFVVDEAHRSTGGESFDAIQKAFKKAAWIGYTGTPMFDNKSKGLRTQDIFGELLHAYTIKEAIKDKNVLGFKVDFETTIDEKEMKEKYLPSFYADQHPKWREDQIKKKIDNIGPEDMDDAVEASFYDENYDHVKLVVEDIFKNWRNRSNDFKYNAMLTTHVGGNKASIPMAVMYYDEFQRVNEERRSKNLFTLKVGITFSINNTNNDQMLKTNQDLTRIIENYNTEFDTEFGLDDVTGYTQDLTMRLKKASSDGKNLDLVIVVDQLLTGFDAPEMNTLYVDRTLKGAGLIQAYSRTNRIHNMQDKPWGRIVNYRWPAYNEKLMKEALAIYSEKTSADLKKTTRELVDDDGILAKEFNTVFKEVKEIVDKLADMTSEFIELPASENKKEEMFGLLRKYNMGMAKLKQYDPEKTKDGQEIGFDYDRPEALLEALGMTSDQEIQLTTVLANELKQELAKIKKVSIYQLELKMTHVKEISVNYDYLNELVADLLNQIHENKKDEAEDTRNSLYKFADGMDDRIYAKKIKNAADAIYNGEYPPEGSDFKYPAKPEKSNQFINQANEASVEKKLLDFRIKWGLVDIISKEDMSSMINSHRYGQDDLDDANMVTMILTESSNKYKTLAYDENIKSMSKIKYRKELRFALKSIADDIVGE